LTQHFPAVDVESLAGVSELRARGWLRRTEERILLTPLGVEYSDQVGPMLYSPAVRDRLREFTAGRNQGGPS